MTTAALFSMTSTSSMKLLEAMRGEFDTVDHYDIRKTEMRIGNGKPLVLYEGEKLDGIYDCVYLKSSFRYALMLKSLATYFEGKAYMPVDPEAFTIVNDKIFTHIALEKGGVPTPETYITPTVREAKRLVKELNFPIILKTPGGTHGKGVMFAESVAAATGILDTLSELKQTVLLQEYIETGGTDIRAIVVGDEVVAAMTRKAVKEEKRSNLHAGGMAEAILLDPNAKKAAIRAAKALECEICGVDLLESVKGPLVLEANLSPGLQGIMKSTGRDVAVDMAKYLRKRTNEWKSEQTKEHHAEAIVEASNNNGEQQIISKIDKRGERILLPEIISKLSGLKEDQEAVMRVRNGKIELEKV